MNSEQAKQTVWKIFLLIAEYIGKDDYQFTSKHSMSILDDDYIIEISWREK